MTTPFDEQDAGDSPAQHDIPLARPAEIGRAWPAQAVNPMTLPGITKGRAAINLLIVLVSFLVAIFAISTVAEMIVGTDRLAHDTSALLIVTMIAGWIVVVVVAMAFPELGTPLRSIGLKSSNLLADAALGLVVTAASFGAFFVCAGAMEVLWPAGFKELQANPAKIEQMVPDWNPALLIAVMFAVACYEELLFRGVLLSHLRKLTGSWTAAILIACAVFASMHSTQVEAAMIPLAGTAIVWSLFAIWRRSIVPSIVGHTLFNFIQVMMLYHVLPPTMPPPAPTSAGWATLLGSLAIGAPCG